MKKYNVTFLTATPAMLGMEDYPIRDSSKRYFNLIRYDLGDEPVEAESETEAISLTFDYIRDNSDCNVEINEENNTVTYFDRDGKLISQDYDFRAVEAA